MVNALYRLVLALSLGALLAACGGGEGGEDGGGEGGAEHGGGGEGRGEGGGEHGSGGGDGAASFISNGVSFGVFESAILMPDEAYAGLLNETEIALSYDSRQGKIVGRVRNEAATAVCDVRVSAELDGYLIIDQTPSGETYAVDGLRPYDGSDFELSLAAQTSFSEWVAVVETFGCSSAPAGTGGEGGEGGNEHGGGEHGGGGEGGGEGGEGGGEGGDGNEDAPNIRIGEVASGIFGNAEYSFLYDMEGMAFRGTVHNPTADFICGSRTEIHMGIGGQVVELGPTIPENLSPGETIKVVMTAPAYMPDAYSVHPESSACP
ncbi:MAG: hypothetical protein OXG44_03885 [Gammaproteobacteria bacterium]|nr:hypothetical protein [Gammaproteobacteria bacterium]